MNQTLIEEKEITNVSATPSFNNSVPSNTPVPTTETISSASLKAQPQVKFPETKPNIQMTAAESLVQGTGDSMINQLKAESAAKTEAAKGNYTNSLDQYIAQLGNQTGFSGFLAEEEKKAGIQALASEAAELEGQINSERLSRAELRTRLDQKGGGLKSGADAEFQNFARDSLFRETNAVIQLGVRSGQLAAAKATAQRVAEAYYEQEQNALSARKELVDLNKELFDKEEQRSFNLQYESAVRELKKQEEELKLTQMTKIDALKMAQMNGAPRDVLDAITNASTPEEVLNVGGQYGSTDLLDRQLKKIQLENIRSQINERNAAKLSSKPPTQSELTARGFGERLLDSSITIEEVGNKFTGLLDRISGAGFFPQGFKSDDRQKFEQAQRNFINAALRRESGASIAPAEFESAELQYFPQPGDSQAVLLQKKRNRDMVTRSVLREGGIDTTVQDRSLADPLGLGVTTVNNNPLEL